MTQASVKTTSTILLSLWGLAFIGILYLGNQTRKSAQIVRSIMNPRFGDQGPSLPKGVSAESQLLLYGDPSKESQDARWKALHESDPDSPLFYVVYLEKADGIPEDFHQTVARIDPDNGWYSIWEASELEPAFKKSPESRLAKKERADLTKKGLPLPPAQFEFTDKDIFPQHLALLEKGLLASRVENYTREIATLRFKAVPSPFDFVSNINAIAISAGYIGSITPWRDGVDTLCAALQLAETEEEFQHLEKLCLKLEDHLHANSTTLVSGLIYHAAVHVQSKSLRTAAGRLELSEAEAFYRERQLRFQKESERRRLDNETSDFESLISRRADILTALSMPAIQIALPDPPQLTAGMLRPALRVERAVAARIFYTAFFFILSLCGLAVWLRGRDRENPATFIPEARTLFRCSLLPFILLLIYRYFLSFGMLDFGGRLLVFTNYLFPEIAILLILLVIPQVLMNKEAHPDRSFLRTWWPAGVAILGLLFSSVMMHLFTLGYGVFLIPGLFLGATVLWILNQVCRRPKPDFDRNGRIAPCYLLSATLCGLFVFALVAEERFWFKEEGLHHASATGLSVFETETTELLNEFVHELRGPDRR